MRRTSVIMLFVSLFALTAQAALADSANFHYANASVDSSTGALTVSFKLTGLGTGVSSVLIDLNAAASATYQCWNNGGHHPKAGNKETVGGPIAQEGNFDVSHGQVTASFTTGPLGPGSFACPSGQTLYLEAVGYSGISVSTEGTGSGAASLDASPSSVSLTGLHQAV
ncbi:MAG: hypothetical protein M3P11_00315 [Actinomycetota bacterium]|nr:hypothetical protein [Actinomycetota bacterium]